MQESNHDQIIRSVRQHYGGVAKSEAVRGSGAAVSNALGSACCPTSSCCGTTKPANGSERFAYSEQEINQLPQGSFMGLGCGNPVSIADIRPGDTVLDLGCGGGADCYLAAERVGASGQVIGVDMTPEMISAARDSLPQHQTNIDFRLGEIENLPMADESADVVISNCVINLSPRKDRVFSEMFRVMRPNGRLAIADMVALEPLPKALQQDLALYVSCIAGAPFVEDLKEFLARAGFDDIRIQFKETNSENADPERDPVISKVIPAMITARKPVDQS
jgi:arsenite methyltransferase